MRWQVAASGCFLRIQLQPLATSMNTAKHVLHSLSNPNQTNLHKYGYGVGTIANDGPCSQ